VSANGDYFLLRFPYNGKQWCSSAGTSCSTPVFAGIVSLLNGKRLTANKAPLGFLNPLLYTAAVQHPTVFTDITVGDNTYSRLSHCKYGFKCAKGWDPVTGLGTPNFPEIVKYLTTVDSKHFYDTERWLNS
jgi:tripeptidyl-peptidase-1